MLIRDPLPSESGALMYLAEATGVFKPGEVASLLGSTLSSFHDGSLGDQHQIKAVIDDDEKKILAWSYYAPSAHAGGVWDVWWIGAHPELQGKGIAYKLLEFIEGDIKNNGGRVVVIETSSEPALEKARKFYPRSGYKECGRIPDFYAVEDAKLIFAKTL